MNKKFSLDHISILTVIDNEPMSKSNYLCVLRFLNASAVLMLLIALSVLIKLFIVTHELFISLAILKTSYLVYVSCFSHFSFVRLVDFVSCNVLDKRKYFQLL